MLKTYVLFPACIFNIPFSDYIPFRITYRLIGITVYKVRKVCVRNVSSLDQNSF